MRQNEKKLAPNIKFQFRNLDVKSVSSLTRTSDYSHLVNNVLAFSGGYDEDAINIYYAGNYTDGGADVFGLNVDPAGAQNAFYPTGFVIVNDAGFTGSSYNFPFNRLTLEHEVVHHLIRQFSFPYDTGEHVPNASGTANLMGPGTLVVPIDGRKPIVFQQTQTEINNRCFNGRWNLP